LALLGIAFYALLLPWHLTSQFAAQLFKAEFGPIAGAMCGSGPASPDAPDTGCPICKGLAAFQLALEAAPASALPTPVGAPPRCGSAHDDIAGSESLVPRSRGPPLIS
jgi:hypothetical protein